MQDNSYTLGVVSLGCTKNRVDTEVMLAQLTQAGASVVSDPALAQVIVVNTCGFVESAKEEAISTILEMAAYKETGVCRVLVVTGCLSQRYGGDLHAEFPEVDVMVGVGQYGNIASIVQTALEGSRISDFSKAGGVTCGPRVLTTPSYSAYVKISEGCDNRCAYCAIPIIRGEYVQREAASVLAEIQSLVAGGVTEVTLVSQDTSRYEGLPKLLEDICEIQGLVWLRILYLYPSRITTELLDTMARLPKVCKYLDLPIQHIDDDMLGSMNRKGTAEDIRRIFDDARARGFLLRTTVIVGFPNETDEAFARLMQFIEDCPIDRLGAFTYSPEEGTVGAQMDGQIEEALKEQRLETLMLKQQEISKMLGEKRVGQTCLVLVEGVSEEGLYEGRSALEAPEIDGNILFFAQEELSPGQYVSVKITGALEYDLMGEMV